MVECYSDSSSSSLREENGAPDLSTNRPHKAGDFIDTDCQVLGESLHATLSDALVFLQCACPFKRITCASVHAPWVSFLAEERGVNL